MGVWNWLMRRRDIDDDLQDEIRTHLAMATQDNIEGGQDPKAAGLRAHKEFGNVLRTTEATRRVGRGGCVEWSVDVFQDVRFGVRQLRRNAGFSLAVITVLTLGIGGNAAVFSMFKALALSPLPGVPRSASLAVIANRTVGGQLRGNSFLDFKDLRDRNQVFDGLAAARMQPVIVGLGRTGERVWAELVTGSYFHVLGVPAQLGRTLQPGDEVAPGQHPVVMLSDGIWRRKFGADPAIVGKTIHVNRNQLTVVGVAPPQFQGTIVSLVNDLYIPVMMQPQLDGVSQLDSRDGATMVVFGRLRPGVSTTEASAQIGVLAAQLATEGAKANNTDRAVVLPLWRSPFGAQTYLMPAVVLLAAMGTLLLVLVCANVANLVLVRGVSRRGELAVRLALGAGRGRILRLLVVVENLVLALPGAIFGVMLSAIALPIAWGSVASTAPLRFKLDTGVDWMVVTFAVGLSCLSALVFGFVPALRTSRVEVAATMKAGREFAESDDASSPQVAIVNETLARRFWDSPEGAIGKRLSTSPGEWRTIVGVARDLKYSRLTEPSRPYVYSAAAQAYRSTFVLHARSRAGGTEVLGRLQDHVRTLDPDLPILSARMLAEQARGDLGTFEMAASVLTMFGAMTIALSALGIYGLVAYTVKQSTQEIGIRLAVGASRADVVRRFAGSGLKLASIGAVVGLAAAIGITQLVANAIGQLGAIDATSVVVATVVVMLIALCASVVPAWRGSRTDPLTALRRH